MMVTRMKILFTCACVALIGQASSKCELTCMVTCKNGSKCKVSVLDLPGCVVTCECRPGFDGDKCDQLTTNITVEDKNTSTVTPPHSFNTTARPNFKVCIVGKLRCYHGECNPFCSCHNGWNGLYCNVSCHLNCGPYGVCTYLRDRDMIACQCQHRNGTHRFTGRNCTKEEITTYKPGTPPTRYVHISDDYWLPVGIVLGILVFIITLVSVCFVVMWKKRAIFILKLVYKFKAYVDQDDKEYDAFISYKSSSGDFNSSQEELFVINELLPKLERDFGFKICVHFRDFVPGLDITDNVLQSIENSHRTIMLISQAYASDSIWTKFEYQQAQVAVINQKQRIIPILFDRVDDLSITDKTLNLILASTTYLEKPSDAEDVKLMDKFWTRLHLSMPKKRRNASIELVDQSIKEHGRQGGTVWTVKENNNCNLQQNNKHKESIVNSDIRCNTDKEAGERYIRYLDRT